MFSKRTSWSFSPNRLARLLQEKKAAAEEVLDLTVSNPTRSGIDYPEGEILTCLRDPRNLTYRPTPYGLETARNAVAQYYAARGRAVSPDELILTASTSEAYGFLFKVLMEPGDQVLIPRPSYPLFDYLAVLEAVEPASYSLAYDGSWSIDWRSLEEALRPRSRAILTVHPANPTGSYLKRDELARLRDLCKEHGLALIVDEVFLDYPLNADPDGSGSVVGEKSVLTFVLSGLSKVAALPQMKLSWIWVGGPDAVRREAHRRLEHVSDVFLSVGAPVENALERFLELSRQIQPLIAARLNSNYAFLREATSATSIDVPRVEGGWYGLLRLPALQSSEDWALELLEADNVYVHPGYLFDFANEAYLVVSLLTETSTFRDAVRRVVDRVRKSVESEGRLN